MTGIEDDRYADPAEADKAALAFRELQAKREAPTEPKPAVCLDCGGKLVDPTKQCHICDTCAQKRLVNMYKGPAPPEPKPGERSLTDRLDTAISALPLTAGKSRQAIWDARDELTRLQARVAELEADKWAKNVQLETMQARVVELEKLLTEADDEARRFFGSDLRRRVNEALNLKADP